MKANVQKKKITGNGFLLLITIALFVVMYVAGMIVFADKGFAKPQMFLNLFVSNAGLLVIAGKSSSPLCGWRPPCLCTGKPGE